MCTIEGNTGTIAVVVVLTLTRIIKSVVTGQAPVTLELRNTPGKNTHNPGWYTHISQLTQFMPPPETYKSEIGSQSTMCQVQAGAYVSLLTRGETKYSDCHPSKTTTYILHVVSITPHTHPDATAACAAGVVTATACRDRVARTVATTGTEGYRTYRNAGLRIPGICINDCNVLRNHP